MVQVFINNFFFFSGNYTTRVNMNSFDVTQRKCYIVKKLCYKLNIRYHSILLFIHHLKRIITLKASYIREQLARGGTGLFAGSRIYTLILYALERSLGCGAGVKL